MVSLFFFLFFFFSFFFLLNHINTLFFFYITFLLTATQGKTQPKPESQENPKSRSQSQDSTEPKAENQDDTKSRTQSQDGTKSRTQSQDSTKSRTQSQDSLNNSTSSTSLESNVNTSIKFRDVRLDPNYEKEKKALLEQREAQNQLQNRNLNPYQPNQSKPIQPTQPPQQKEQPKETQKEIPKEEPKEQPKEPKKEQSTEQSKVTQKEEPKEEQLKEQPKQQPKENNHLPRTESNDNVPKNENSKEPSPSLQPTKTNNDEVQFIEKLDEIKKSQDDLKQEIISAQNNLKILLEKWEFLDSKIKGLEKVFSFSFLLSFEKNSFLFFSLSLSSILFRNLNNSGKVKILNSNKRINVFNY